MYDGDDISEVQRALAVSHRWPGGYVEGLVVVSCADDHPAYNAGQDLRAELENLDAFVRHATIEAIVDAADEGDGPNVSGSDT